MGSMLYGETLPPFFCSSTLLQIALGECPMLRRRFRVLQKEEERLKIREYEPCPRPQSNPFPKGWPEMAIGR